MKKQKTVTEAENKEQEEQNASIEKNTVEQQNEENTDLDSVDAFFELIGIEIF